MTILSNTRGMSAVQVLMVMAVMSIVNLGIMQIMETQDKRHRELNFKTSALAIRQNIVALLGNQGAWSRTFQANSAVMRCISSNQTYCNPAKPDQIARLRFLDSSGAVILDPAPNMGFTAYGEPCDSYTPAGNDRCPLRVELFWRGACTPATCASFPTNAAEVKYQEYISVRFTFSPGSSRGMAFNTQNYNLTEQTRMQLADNVSPAVACGLTGGIFVGPGAKVGTHTADQRGCIPYAAFFGAKGDSGPPGPPGPQGVCP